MGTLTKNKFTIITSQKLNVGDEKHDPFIYYMEYSLRSLDTESVCSNLCKNEYFQNPILNFSCFYRMIMW